MGPFEPSMSGERIRLGIFGEIDSQNPQRYLRAMRKNSSAAAKPIETVIAGLGRAGWDIHWKLLKDHKAFRVVGAIEPLESRRQEAEKEMGCRTYASFKEFLKSPVGELIVIATPSGGHAEEGIACLKKGIHVAIDKPMCQSLKEADTLMAVSKRNKLVLTAFHPHRFGPEFNTLRDIIRSGRLGRIVEIRNVMVSFRRRNDWVMTRIPGAGMHNVWGSHMIDLGIQLANSPLRDVFCDLQTTVTPGDADDHARIIFRCKNGILFDTTVSHGMVLNPEPQWLVSGTCGGVSIQGSNVHVKWYDPKKAPPIKIVKGAAMNRRYDNDDVLQCQEERFALPTMRGSIEFYDNLADAIRKGKHVAVSPQSVRETIRVLDICRKQSPHIWKGF